MYCCLISLARSSALTKVVSQRPAVPWQARARRELADQAPLCPEAGPAGLGCGPQPRLNGSQTPSTPEGRGHCAG